MDIIKTLIQEIENEANTTRKFLALVPFEKKDWAPHEKSMKLLPLAAHLADITRWAKMGIETKELDFATAPYEAKEIKDDAELLEIFENNVKDAVETLSKITEADLDGRWVLRTGETIHADMSKYEIIRHSLNQTTHHRAQLGVYFRLLGIPLPGSYGPSADDTKF